MKDNSSLKVHEIAEVKHELKQLKESIEFEDFKVLDDNNQEININDKVYIEGYNITGTVTKINKNKYYVTIGNTNMMFDKDDLKLVKEAIEVPVKKTSTIITPRKTVPSILDLRGKKYEDAEPLIDDYITDASYAGLHTVSIIHGFGTGVIRELVQNKLKNNPYVDSYRYGGEKEGRQGVTVVTLK